MIDFFDISYLANGTAIQKKGYAAIKSSGTMMILKRFDPVVVGTLPLDLFTSNSDIDIICFCKNAEDLPDFGFRAKLLNGVESYIANFRHDGFDFEIVAQPVPVREQVAYRHMLAEWKILSEKGPEFKEGILALKQSGVKTEPAFAQLLGLKGDPYIELLRL
ncbi:MAG TPA: DUF4269 domain-containing protein [Cyclobacteriaceae bacterium]|nr:DUF4269 domain-containing protein [Cyclobacteriaceae bacterium]